MTIEERLENMEREMGRLNRHNRWLLGAILLAAGGLIVPGVLETTAFRARAQVGGTVKEIRARSIVIEDENGKTRVELGTDESGPNLKMLDENIKVRVGLYEFKGNSAITLYNENGTVGAGLLGSGMLGPGLTLCDENGHFRASLGAGKDGFDLNLYDEKNILRVGLKAGKYGPSLWLGDENEKPRVVLDAFKDGPRLSLQDENGKTRFAAGKSKVFTSEGKTFSCPESSLILYGPDNKVIWSAIK